MHTEDGKTLSWAQKHFGPYVKTRRFPIRLFLNPLEILGFYHHLKQKCKHHCLALVLLVEWPILLSKLLVLSVIVSIIRHPTLHFDLEWRIYVLSAALLNYVAGIWAGKFYEMITYSFDQHMENRMLREVLKDHGIGVMEFDATDAKDIPKIIETTMNELLSKMKQNKPEQDDDPVARLIRESNALYDKGKKGGNPPPS